LASATSTYPGGTPLQIFSSVPGSVTAQYEKADGTNNGDVVAGTAAANRELLMQMTLGSGAHATALCPGGRAGIEGPLALDATAPPPQAPGPPVQDVRHRRQEDRPRDDPPRPHPPPG